MLRAGGQRLDDASLNLDNPQLMRPVNRIDKDWWQNGRQSGRQSRLARGRLWSDRLWRCSDECDITPVERPLEPLNRRAVARQPERLSTDGRVKKIDLGACRRISATLGEKSDPCRVGGPARMIIPTRVARQPVVLACVCRHPEIGVVTVTLTIPTGQNVDHPLPVRGNLNIARAVDADDILRCLRAFCLCGNQLPKRDQQDHEVKDSAHQPAASTIEAIFRFEYS